MDRHWSLLEGREPANMAHPAAPDSALSFHYNISLSPASTLYSNSSNIEIIARQSLAPTDGMLTSIKYLAFLKASATWDPDPKHLTLIKQRPLCSGAAYRPMSPRDGDTSDLSAPSAGHGPYCCEGSGCPREDEYATKEYNCLMPASSMLGVPRCANLIGSPLPNLALASAGAKASLSSEYPYTENAGVGAAIDGRLDGKYVLSVAAYFPISRAQACSTCGSARVLLSLLVHP